MVDVSLSDILITLTYSSYCTLNFNKGSIAQPVAKDKSKMIFLRARTPQVNRLDCHIRGTETLIQRIK
jgi:hypothetical protein